MFQFFNFNFDTLNKRENASRFSVFGYLLVVLGIFSFIYKGAGIKVVSWTLAIALLFIAYLNLKNINELRRYASRSEISPYTRAQFILLAVVALLIFFPVKTQSIVSFLCGGYIVFSQIYKFIQNKNNPYYRFGFTSVLASIFGLTLIFSPLFLSRFIVSILSLVILLIGFQLVSTGNRLKSL